MKRAIFIITSLLLALLSAQSLSQVSTVTVGTGVSTMTLTEPQPPDLSKAKFILVTSHSEPCPECGFVYAVACMPRTPNCGMPFKKVYDYAPFETAEAAIKFLQDNQGKDFIKLFSITGVDVEITKEVRTIKHEDDHETITLYKVKAHPLK